MLENKDAVATVAVEALAAAREFYEGALGLKQMDAERGRYRLRERQFTPQRLSLAACGDHEEVV